MFYKYSLLQMYPCSDFNHSTKTLNQPGLQPSHGGSTTAPACVATWLQSFHLPVLLLGLSPVVACTVQLLSVRE